jgi:glycosyltransferase involved in cell wall biosynthesis
MGGVYHYILNYINTLKEIDHANEFILFVNAFRNINWRMINNLQNDIKERTNFGLKVLRLPQRLWRPFNIPIETFTGTVSILHGLNSELLPSRCRAVVTVHDLRSLKFNMEMLEGPCLNCREYKRRRDFFLRRRKLLPWSLKKADRIISVSDFTRRCIIENFDIPEDKIDVVYHGVSDIFRRIEDRERIEDTKKRLKINKEYLLYVGKLDPMKNIERLIDAFKLIKRDLDIVLVLSGPRSWYSKFIEAKIRDYGLTGDVILTDYVSPENLVALYNGAVAFVFPSLYEGFGLPLLEAMRCGCPVIASDVGAIPEIVSDSAALFNPHSEEEMAHTILNILSDKGLRNRLIKSGLERTISFTWEKTVTDTLRVYRKCLR